MRNNHNINNEEVLKLTIDSLLKKDKKVIFVFGAGASSSSGIAGGKFLKDELTAFLTKLKETKKVIDAFNEAYQTIPDKFKGKDFDETIRKLPLEYLISLGCKVFREATMIDWLKRYIPDVYKSKIRYFPPIAYELVSHLMNNGLIQHVVTLNYDELLDKTIEEELGKGKSHRIATIEDFESLRREQNWKRISRLFIFKPHGTISLPMSLIHKYQQTLEFEEEKADVLKKLFKNKILVLVGYEANDEDFRLLLHEQLLIENIEKVFVVKRSPEDVLKKLPEKNVIGYEGRGEFFEELAEKFHDEPKFKDYTKATRHFIRCRVYQKLSPGNPVEKEYDLKQKKLKDVIKRDPLFFTRLNLFLEILIFSFKTRGLFTDTALMSCNRINSALKEHLKMGEQEAKKPGVKELLDQLADPENGILKRMPIKKRLESYWYYLPLPPEFDNISINAQKIEELYKESARKALEVLNNAYLNKIENPLEKNTIDYLIDEFFELQRDFDYDMSEQYTPYLIFKDPLPLKDREEFRQITNKILNPEKEESNSILYIISLTGEWLKRFEISKCITTIKVITDAEINLTGSLHYRNVLSFQSEILKDKISEIRSVKGINHRITLRFKGDDTSGIEGEAIYFYRSGKGSSFAPFYLQNNVDIMVLKAFFDNLCTNHHERVTNGA